MRKIFELFLLNPNNINFKGFAFSKSISKLDKTDSNYLYEDDDESYNVAFKKHSFPDFNQINDDNDERALGDYRQRMKKKYSHYNIGKRSWKKFYMKKLPNSLVK